VEGRGRRRGWRDVPDGVRRSALGIRTKDSGNFRIRELLRYPRSSVDAGELSRLQLIIRPGEEGGIITQTEFMFSKFCAEEKLKTKTSDRLISMIKRRDFVIEDICAETIRELETLG
jgi:hypothetical protein